MMNYYELTEEMKRYSRFIVWVLYEDKPMAMDPETLQVYDTPSVVEWMKYGVAKRHMQRIRKETEFEVNLAFVDEGGNLRLFEI